MEGGPFFWTLFPTKPQLDSEYGCARGSVGIMQKILRYSRWISSPATLEVVIVAELHQTLDIGSRHASLEPANIDLRAYVSGT